MKALIFGSTGSVGQEVLKNLQSENIPIHAVRRQSAPAASPGVKWFTHDVLQGPGSAEMWKDITHVFVMAPPGYLNQDQIIIPVIEKAKSQNVQKIVLMTAMGVDHALGSPLQKSEVALQTSGLNHAIIRPNWFMQNFHTYWGQALRNDKTVLVPAGDARTSFIDARDIGAVASRLLTSHVSGEYDLTGPEAITLTEVSNILSETLGTRIRYVDAEPKSFQEGLVKSGLPADYAAFMMIILGALRDGHAARVTSHVEQILQRKSLGFADYVRDFQSLLS